MFLLDIFKKMSLKQSSYEHCALPGNSESVTHVQPNLTEKLQSQKLL